jgi:TolB-like protein/DNA-binding winged helix-turn-helix (wHTH) protein
MDVPTAERGIFLFGPFRLEPARRALLRDGMRVNLPAPLFDTLVALVERADRVVEADELAAAAWRGRAPEALGTADIVAALNRLLDADENGEAYISAAAPDAYRFTARVQYMPPPDLPGRASLFDETGALLPEPMVVERRSRSPRRRQLVAIGALALVAVAAGLVVWLTVPAQLGFTPPAQSVSVLAFVSADDDPREHALAGTVTANLIAALGQVEGVSVAARDAPPAVGIGKDVVRQIARRLNVGAVLQGSVKLYAQRVRINAWLGNGVTGALYWSRSYDRAQDEIPATERQITADVTATLRGVRLQGPS